MSDGLWALVLEYLAFGGSLCSVWLYGYRGIRGPSAGLLTACAFIAFGLVAGIYAAVLSNCVFMVIHGRNFRRAWAADEEKRRMKIEAAVNTLVDLTHGAATTAGWWAGVDLANPYVVPTKLALIHSEVSEALEGHRCDAQDSHFPHRPSIEVELADALIRITDLAGALDLDLGGAVAEKMAYNATRPDHKPGNRAAAGGKKY